MTRPIAVALACVTTLAAPTAARADDLKVDLRIDIPVLLGASALAAGLALPRFAPQQCRLCTAHGLDEAGRELLLLPTNGLQAEARHASDVIVSGILPAGALTMSAISAHRDGDWRELLDDAVVITESTVLAADLTGLTKDTVARRRPAPDNTSQHGSRNESFYSGHASQAFSLATAAATVATIRGRSYAPWMWGVGETLAAGVAYLRVAGDAHWVSDVVVGSAAGAAVGFAVPWLFHRIPGARRRRFAMRPAPGGLAVTFP